MRKYGFGDRLSATYPSQIVVDLTQVCNLACTHCPHNAYVKRTDYHGLHLSEELHTKLIDDVAANNNGACQYLRYTAAGEPLLHPQIYSFLAYAKRHSGTTISLTTNGTLLNATARENILKIGVDVIDISIDAYSSEVYSRIRRGGNRDKVYANVQALIEAKRVTGSSLHVVTTFIDQPDNHHEVEIFKSFWEEAGADYVIIRRLHSSAGGDTGIAEQIRASWMGLERYPCLYPWERLTITYAGQIKYCPSNWNDAADFASLASSTIQEAWQGAFMTALREAHLKNAFDGIPLCGQCPDWSCTRWPADGRSFADMILDFKESE